MPNEQYYLIGFITSALVVLGFRICLNRHWELTSKTPPTFMRSGGVLIFVGYFVALLMIWLIGGFSTLSEETKSEIFMITRGGLFFGFIGVFNDFSRFSYFRLLRQLRFHIFIQLIFAFAWALTVKISIKSLTVLFVGVIIFPSWISALITGIWVVLIVHFLKWSESRNGLGVGIASIASLVSFITILLLGTITDTPVVSAALVGSAIAGAILGFLYSQNHIFMGSGGAYFIGFIITSVGMIGLIKSVTAAALILSYFILVVPIIDMPMSILRKILLAFWKRLRQLKVDSINLDKLRFDNIFMTCLGSLSKVFKNEQSDVNYRMLQANLSQRLSILLINSLILLIGSIVLAFLGRFIAIAYLVVSILLLYYTVLEIKKHPRKN